MGGESGEKTEQPTHKKLEDAKKKGQVLKSQDLTQALSFLVAAGVLYGTGSFFVNGLKGLMKNSFGPELMEGRFPLEAIYARLVDISGKALLLCAPLLLALMIAGSAANIAQLQGVKFSAEALQIKWDKFNPVTGFQHLFFELKPYTEVIKSVVKFILVLVLGYTTINEHLREIILVSRLNIQHTAILAGTLISTILFKIGAAFMVFGAADFGLQAYLYKKNLMMTKDEVKREHKDSEGDPHIKSQRKALAAAMLKEGALKQVPKAQAVIVNPTHIAVALRYDGEESGAPRVVAKGEMEMADTIRRIAKEHRVPILRNVPLARSLNTLELEEEIPEQLYVSVAEVLNLVSRLADGKQN